MSVFQINKMVPGLSSARKEDVLSMAAVVRSSVPTAAPGGRPANHVVHTDTPPSLLGPVCQTVPVPHGTPSVSHHFADCVCGVHVEVIIADGAAIIDEQPLTASLCGSTSPVKQSEAGRMSSPWSAG